MKRCNFFLNLQQGHSPKRPCFSVNSQLEWWSMGSRQWILCLVGVYCCVQVECTSGTAPLFFDASKNVENPLFLGEADCCRILKFSLRMYLARFATEYLEQVGDELEHTTRTVLGGGSSALDLPGSPITTLGKFKLPLSKAPKQAFASDQPDFNGCYFSLSKKQQYLSWYLEIIIAGAPSIRAFAARILLDVVTPIVRKLTNLREFIGRSPTLDKGKRTRHSSKARKSQSIRTHEQERRVTPTRTSQKKKKKKSNLVRLPFKFCPPIAAVA